MESSADRLARALSASGVTTAIVARPTVGEGVASTYVRDGVQVVRVEHRERLSLLTGLRSWRRSATAAVAALEPDVVHGQGLLIGGLAACDVSGVPRLVTAHGNLRQDTLSHYRGLGGAARAFLRDRLVKSVVRRADEIVGVHPDWRINLPVEPARFTYVPNIVDDEFFDVDAAPEEGRVLYCGGARHIKGWDVLFEAWPSVRADLPGATLCATGFVDGPPGPLPEGVVIRGLLSVADLAEEMARASCVVIPSRYEVAPMLLFEACAAGVPVVATAVGGMPALGAGTATLVPSEQPRELAAAVTAVLEAGPNAAMVAEGRRRAGAAHPEAVADAHIRLYERLSSRP